MPDQLHRAPVGRAGQGEGHCLFLDRASRKVYHAEIHDLVRCMLAMLLEESISSRLGCRCELRILGRISLLGAFAVLQAHRAPVELLGCSALCVVSVLFGLLHGIPELFHLAR